jgi:hypothetical protein
MMNKLFRDLLIYEYIHLIGHSAGAKLINKAAQQLAVDKNRQNAKKPFIHLTFLDAYTRDATDDRGYGSLPNYSEHYVDRTPFTIIAPWTK